MNDIWMPISFVLFGTFSLHGLLGAVFRKFKFTAGKRLAIKKYVGKQAVIWGVIFFISFGIFPIVIINDVLTNSLNQPQITLLYVFFTIFAIFLAFILRKFGVYSID